MSCVYEFLTEIQRLGIHCVARREGPTFFCIDLREAGSIYVPNVPSLVLQVVQAAEACCPGDALLDLRERVALVSDLEEPFVYWLRENPECPCRGRGWIRLGEWLDRAVPEETLVSPLRIAAE